VRCKHWTMVDVLITKWKNRRDQRIINMRKDMITSIAPTTQVSIKVRVGAVRCKRENGSMIGRNGVWAYAFGLCHDMHESAVLDGRF